MNDDNFIGLGALKGPHGDQLYTHLKVPMVHVGAFVITDKNPYPEATVRWIDHFFGEEGATFYFMGKEGETYEKLEDGTLEYTKDITDNPDGLTHDQALAKNFTWLGGKVTQVMSRQIGLMVLRRYQIRWQLEKKPVLM